MAEVSPTGGYVGETAWNDGGGGYVTLPKEPRYQKSASIADPYDTLAKPDVSADAGTSVWVYNQGFWSTVDGTSVAAPLWAGFMADANQIRAENHFSPAGFIDPFLYTTVYQNSALYSSDFHDIVTGDNGRSAGVGWDAATGLGSFVAQNLASTLGNNESA